MSKKALILGGSSDIGSLLVKKFLKKNYNVTAHFNQTNKKLNNLKCKKLLLCKATFFNKPSPRAFVIAQC